MKLGKSNTAGLSKLDDLFRLPEGDYGGDPIECLVHWHRAALI